MLPITLYCAITNIYNNLDPCHIILIIPLGYKPYHNVGIIKAIINRLSRYVQSLVNAV